MLNGKDGNVEYMDSIGCTGFSSPVVYDLNNDGHDEAIISVNDFDCSLGYASKSPQLMENKLIAIDFFNKSVQILDQAKGFKNIFLHPGSEILTRMAFWISSIANTIIILICCHFLE